MISTRVLAIRHGETDWNVQGRIQGQLDVRLNGTGRWQAGRLGEALADDSIDVVYASDLSRALETAQAVARFAGHAVMTDVGLRERAFGAFEGLTFDEIRARWPEQAERWRKRDPSFGAEGGETLQAFYDRSVGAVARIAARHPGRTVAVVSHGGVMDGLYRAATRLALDAPRSWQLGNASINRLLHTDSGFALIGWSDAQHLERGVLDEPGEPGGPADPRAVPVRAP